MSGQLLRQMATIPGRRICSARGVKFSQGLPDRTFKTLSRHLNHESVAMGLRCCVLGEDLLVPAPLPSQAPEDVSSDLVQNVHDWGRTRALQFCEMGHWRLHWDQASTGRRSDHPI